MKTENEQRLEAENKLLKEALFRCNELFSLLRGDWSDNRHWCRQGWAIVEKALNGESLKGTLDEEHEEKFTNPSPHQTNRT